jgi:2-succinyl-6-hydroxy-2,4-cyclohexadiene-1-carboxylate synthase
MPEFSTLISGNPSNPPLILFHGFLGSKEDWEETLFFLKEKYYCVAFDLPGHGDTAYCEDILSALRQEIGHLFSQKPIIAGYSMGGRIAMQLKSLAKALIIFSAHPGLQTQQEREERMKSDQRWSDKLLKLPFEEFLADWYAQPLFQCLTKNPIPLHILERRAMKNKAQNLAPVLLQMSLAKQPLIEDFPCPTLFLYGEKDLKYRALYAKLAPTVSVCEVRGCGHTLLIDNALMCSKIILNWRSIHADDRG